MKSEKKSFKGVNAPIDMLIHVLIPLFGIGGIVGILVSGESNWAIWLIFAMLALMSLYYVSMLLYKLYRARLSFVKIDTNRIVFFSAFKKTEILSENMQFALSDYGRPTSKTKYVIISDKTTNGDGLLFAVSSVKGLNRYKDCVPLPLLKIIIALTNPEVLNAMLKNCSDSLKELIENDLKQREETRIRENEEARRKRKRKKGKTYRDEQ